MTQTGAMLSSSRLVVAAVVGLAPLTASCRKAPSAAEPPPLRVAAASDLAEAFPAVGAAFEKATGQKVTFSFNSTGLLAKQIEQGAPFEVFAAANVSFVDEAIGAGACAADSKAVYAQGRLDMWTKADARAVPGSLADLARPEFVHVAIANPDHAPYGKAAKEALVKSGVWPAIEKKVVFGENVQQTFQFAQSGNAEVALIAHSLALASGGHATPVDPALHAPLNQAVVVCSGGARSAEERDRSGAAARKFVAFIGSNDGRAILRRYGFLLPGEALGGTR
ncbi:MAG TPA: molybdate ABC transporter substrate-binding protein [Polyangiaceae bacterium]